MRTTIDKSLAKFFHSSLESHTYKVGEIFDVTLEFNPDVSQSAHSHSCKSEPTNIFHVFSK